MGLRLAITSVSGFRPRVALLRGLFLTACASASPGTAPYQSPVASALAPTAQPVPTTTLSTPTATVRGPESPTRTPLATLPGGDPSALVADLLAYNRGWALPCWWGIAPRETPWIEADNFLSNFAEVARGDPGTVIVGGKEQVVTPYYVSFTIPGPVPEGGASLAVRNGVVTNIAVGPNATSPRFILRSIPGDYPLPSQVLVRTFATPGPSTRIPFQLVLLYEENRFLAFYDFDGIISNGNVLGCPGATSPWLWMWSEDLAHLWTDPQFVQEAVLGPGTRPLRPLQDVSSEDLSSFATRLGEDSGCIETPASYWGIGVAVSLRAEISYVGAVNSPRPPGWLAAYPWYYPSPQS